MLKNLRKILHQLATQSSPSTTDLSINHQYSNAKDRLCAWAVTGSNNAPYNYVSNLIFSLRFNTNSFLKRNSLQGDQCGSKFVVRKCSGNKPLILFTKILLRGCMIQSSSRPSNLGKTCRNHHFRKDPQKSSSSHFGSGIDHVNGVGRISYGLVFTTARHFARSHASSLTSPFFFISFSTCFFRV